MAEPTYSEPESRYEDGERCQRITTRGDRCRRAWAFRHNDTGEWVCAQHYHQRVRLAAR